MNIPFHDAFPAELIPLELLGDSRLQELFKKNPDLKILNDKPWNVETPAHLLDDSITPASKMFIRNNGLFPKDPDPDSWTLRIDGESVLKSLDITLKDLKEKFTKYTYRLTLECGGNGRHEFNPPAKGNQWSTGAVSCGEWSGVRLKDILEKAGLKSDAVYLGYFGADTHISGKQDKVVISRGVPLTKALQDESLLAYELNGSPLPLANGFPLRLVFGGWPASTSGKWVNRISVRNKVHDGPKMGGQSYRVPCEEVAPGENVPDENMCIIESMPVKSLITFPKSGAILNKGKSLTIRGHAWAGELEVSQVSYSIDYGQTWLPAKLERPANRLAWQDWKAEIDFPGTGYYEVWAKATDSSGKSQPMVVPGWNPRGYLNNACHRIAIKVK